MRALAILAAALLGAYLLGRVSLRGPAPVGRQDEDPVDSAGDFGVTYVPNAWMQWAYGQDRRN